MPEDQIKIFQDLPMKCLKMNCPYVFKSQSHLNIQSKDEVIYFQCRFGKQGNVTNDYIQKLIFCA